jgi:hypothetical protein
MDRLFRAVDTETIDPPCTSASLAQSRLIFVLMRKQQVSDLSGVELLLSMVLKTCRSYPSFSSVLHFSSICQLRAVVNARLQVSYFDWDLTVFSIWSAEAETVWFFPEAVRRSHRLRFVHLNL